MLLRTGLRAGEARQLQWIQVGFGGGPEEGHISILKAKTKAGRRKIPMTSKLWATLTHYRAWYESKLGPIEPSWYVFPKSEGEHPVDPTKPLASFQRSWTEVRKATGTSYRMHDCRHTVVSRLVESDADNEITMMQLVGHASRKMVEYYSHIRMETKRAALAKALDPKSDSLDAPVRKSAKARLEKMVN